MAKKDIFIPDLGLIDGKDYHKQAAGYHRKKLPDESVKVGRNAKASQSSDESLSEKMSGHWETN